MANQIHMMVDCNDYRNGSFAGRASSFSFRSGKHELTLAGRSVKFIWLPSRNFHIGRRTRPHFDCEKVKRWVGNWCWDETVITKDTAVNVIRLLKRLGFSPQSGSEKAWIWFEQLTPA